MQKVYCAGPLFNKKEQEEMAEISTVLGNNGFNTFLPQRDGLELIKISDLLEKLNFSKEEINPLLARAIFSLDIYHVLTSNALVLNMNGRVPDEGASVEAGVAFSAGIPITIFKNDTRTSYNGTDNPMLLGLSNFEVVTEIGDIPNKIEENRIHSLRKAPNLSDYKKICTIGEKIAMLLSNTFDDEKIALKLVQIFD